MQKGLDNLQKENLLEDLELEEVEFRSAREFLLKLKKEFGRGDKESVKVAKLKKIEWEERTIEKFIQEFRKAVWESSYEKRVLVEKFKRRINGVIRRKLIET